MNPTHKGDTMKLLLHLVLTFATGGLWLVVLAVAAIVKFLKN